MLKRFQANTVKIENNRRDNMDTKEFKGVIEDIVETRMTKKV